MVFEKLEDIVGFRISILFVHLRSFVPFTCVTCVIVTDMRTYRRTGKKSTIIHTLHQ